MVSALVLIACYVSIGRYYATYVEGYQREIVDYLQDYTGLPLEIEHISAQWSVLSPVLSLRNIALPSQVGGDDVLRIERISFQLDLFNSLSKRAIQLRNLRIDGLEGSVEEVAPGSWQLQNYAAAANQKSPGDLDKIVDILLSLDAVELSAAYLKLHYFEGADYAVLNIDEVSLSHAGGFRRARVKASFDNSNKPLLAIVESNGDPRDDATFTAKAYLKLDDVDFATQLPAIKPLGLDLHYARVDSEIWLDWKSGGEIAIQGRIKSPLVDLAAISAGATPLSDFEVHFRAEKQVPDHWTLWLPRLRASWQGAQIGFDQLMLTADSSSVTVALPVLELEENLRFLSGVALLAEPINVLLQTLNPAGALQAVQLHLPRSLLAGADPGAQQYDSPLLRSNFRQLSAQPWKGAPGVTGLSGYLEVGVDGGLVEIDSDTFSLSFPKLYRQPMVFSSARGQLRWSLAADNVVLNSGPLYLTAEHGPATALFSLDLPKVKSAAVDPLMSLVVGLQDTDTSFRDKFIPRVLSPGLRQWLDDSIAGGQVRSGGMLYRGSLTPGDKADQTLQLFFDVAGTDLNYHADWPPLESVDGLVVVDDGLTTVTASGAEIYGMAVTATHVEVSTLAQGGLWLTIQGAVNGAASSALRVVNDSALRQIVGSAFERWRLTGTASAVLDLAIPLGQPALEPVLSVDLEFSDTQLEIPDYRLKFVDLNGPLHYSSDKGLWSDAISAQFFDRPLRASISQGEDKVLQVDASALIDMADIERWSGQPALSFFSGASVFDAQVVVKPGGDSALTLSSELRGVAIDLPPPYNKIDTQPQPFSLGLPLRDAARLHISMEQWGQMQLNLAKGTPVSGLLHLGDAASPLPAGHEAGLFTITGEMESAELEPWQFVLQDYISAGKRLAARAVSAVEATEKTAAPVLSEPQPRRDLAIRVEQLVINKLDVYGQAFDRTQLSAQYLDRLDSSLGFNLYGGVGGWHINAENSILAGNLLLPEGSAESDTDTPPLRVHLSRLSLPQDSTTSAAADSPDPAKLNSFAADVYIDSLVQGDEVLGDLAFELRPLNNGIRLGKIRGTIREVAIKPVADNQLSWWHDEQGIHSQLRSTFSIDNVGDVLERWQYQRIIESKSGQFAVDISWPGNPDQWQLQYSEGTVDLGLRKGRFLKGSDAAEGTLKVVSIVNLARVLSLQSSFSDFFESGISFDRLGGQISLAGQQLNITEDINITSSSSEFSLRGVTDMGTKMVDMELIVTLPVAGNLPWIAAFTAGLPVAAGVFVVSKIFQRQVKKFSSGVYAIGGDWNNPKMDLKKVFGDVGGSKASPARGAVDASPGSGSRENTPPPQRAVSAEVSVAREGSLGVESGDDVSP